MDELKKVGVEVLGISTDKPEKLSRFAEKELLNFTLLSDEDHRQTRVQLYRRRQSGS